jgi:hypothetical protein
MPMLAAHAHWMMERKFLLHVILCSRNKLFLVSWGETNERHARDGLISFASPLIFDVSAPPLSPRIPSD